MLGRYSRTPALSCTILSGHHLLSGHLAKSRKFCYLNTVKVIFIKRSPLLSGHGHPLYSSNVNISLFWTCFKQSPQMLPKYKTEF